MAEKTVEERLATIEENIRASVEIWKLHTEQDMTQFQYLRDAIDELKGKVDELRLAEAARAGAAAESKKVTTAIGAVAGTVAAIVTANVRDFFGV